MSIYKCFFLEINDGDKNSYPKNLCIFHLSFFHSILVIVFFKCKNKYAFASIKRENNNYFKKIIYVYVTYCCAQLFFQRKSRLRLCVNHYSKHVFISINMWEFKPNYMINNIIKFMCELFRLNQTLIILFFLLSDT